MNEQLKTLKEQAIQWGFDQVDSGNEYTLRELHDLVESKFAESIVKKCMALCLTSVGNQDYNTGRMHCHDNIKEVFGIK